MMVNLFSGILLASAVFSIVMGVLFWRRLRTQTAFTAFILFVAGAVWLASYAAELLLPGMALKVFANKVQYLGVAVLLSGLVVFSFQVLNYTRWITRRNIILLTSVYAVLLVFVFTNEYHGLMWPYHYFKQTSQGPFLTHPHGIVYWLIIGYGELMLVITTAVIIRGVLQSRHLFRQQALVLLMGMAVPWFFHIVGLFGIDLIEPFNPAPLAFVGGMTFIALGLWRLQMGSLLPVARTTIVETIDDGVVVLDAYRHVIDANPMGLRLLRSTYSAQSIIGKTLEEINSDWVSQIEQRSGTLPKRLNFFIDGEEYTYDMRVTPLKAMLGGVGHIIVLRDVTEQTLAAEQLQESLTEKEVLLKEIHHRVKNNLQIISSLLFLQSRNTESEVAQESLTESQNRVRSMALVHEQLYQSTDLAKIDFIKYVRVLVSNLQQAFGAETRGISAVVQGESIHFDIDTAIPCGLILNELLSNAFKYAFPNGNGGEISVAIEPIADDKIRLQVSDNGIGLPDDFHTANRTSLGVTLVRSLSMQLKGEAHFIAAKKGTTVDVIFPQNH